MAETPACLECNDTKVCPECRGTGSDFQGGECFHCNGDKLCPYCHPDAKPAEQEKPDDHN